MYTEMCKCNMCENILIDENPQVGSVKYKIIGNELAMTIHNYCPICETDSYLVDL